MHLVAFNRRVGFPSRTKICFYSSVARFTTRSRGLNVGQKSVEQCFLLPSSNSDKAFWGNVGFLIADSRTNGGVVLLCAVRLFRFSLGRLVTKSIVVVCPRNGLTYSSSLLFPLTVTFKLFVVYLEDGSFFTIFNRSILQSVSIFFLRHRVLPAVVEDTLEAHTYGSRLAAVAIESNWGRTHQTHKRGDETMGLLKLSWCRVV